MGKPTYEEVQERREAAQRRMELADRTSLSVADYAEQRMIAWNRRQREARQRLANDNAWASFEKEAAEQAEKGQVVGQVHADGTITPLNADGSPAADSTAVDAAVDARLNGPDANLRHLFSGGNTSPTTFEGQPTQGQLGLAGISVDAAGMQSLRESGATRTSRYAAGQGEEILSSLGPVREAKVKQQLLRAGLISESDTVGKLRNSSITNAFEQVLGHANESGLDWETALADVEMFGVATGASGRAGGGAGGQGRAGFVVEAYSAPDYDTLAQEAKTFARQRIGRDLKDYEVKLWAERLGGFHREGYDANVQAARLNYDATERAIETGEDQGSAGTVQGVDPAASFKEYFEEKYAPEINVEEQEASGAEASARFMRSIATVDRNV